MLGIMLQNFLFIAVLLFLIKVNGEAREDFIGQFYEDGLAPQESENAFAVGRELYRTCNVLPCPSGYECVKEDTFNWWCVESVSLSVGSYCEELRGEACQEGWTCILLDDYYCVPSNCLQEAAAKVFQSIGVEEQMELFEVALEESSNFDEYDTADLIDVDELNAFQKAAAKCLGRR